MSFAAAEAALSSISYGTALALNLTLAVYSYSIGAVPALDCNGTCPANGILQSVGSVSPLSANIASFTAEQRELIFGTMNGLRQQPTEPVGRYTFCYRPFVWCL